MKSGFWTCPGCETEWPDSVTVCTVCPPESEPGELEHATHMSHLAASLRDKYRWRVAGSGPGYVIVAARSKDVAARYGIRLLQQSALADQTANVTEVTRRGWLVYVRVRLEPYPSLLPPWQRTAPRREPPPLPARAPVEGRAYIGRVLSWLGECGEGQIQCSDRRIGSVQVRRSELGDGEEDALRAGQSVAFTIKKTAGGPVAINIVPLGPLKLLPAPPPKAAEQAPTTLDGWRGNRRPPGGLHGVDRVGQPVDALGEARHLGVEAAQGAGQPQDGVLDVGQGRDRVGDLVHVGGRGVLEAAERVADISHVL